MKKGDVLLVSFTGKELTNNTIFETTDEKVAKENGLYKEGSVFRPVPVVLGTQELFPLMENELEKMNEGEERTVVLESKDAFGERRKDLVAVMPLQEFKKRNINPFAGLIVDLDGRYGKVQSVSGGRVRVDMNSDLAGKKVEYRIKIEKHLKDPKEAADALAQKFFGFGGKKVNASLGGQELEVSLPPGMPQQAQALKEAFVKLVTENVKEITKVRFVEEFEGKAKIQAENNNSGEKKGD